MDTIFQTSRGNETICQTLKSKKFHIEVPSFKITLKSGPTWSQGLLT